MLAFIHGHVSVLPLLVALVCGAALMAICFEPGGVRELKRAEVEPRREGPDDKAPPAAA